MVGGAVDEVGFWGDVVRTDQEVAGGVEGFGDEAGCGPEVGVGEVGED